MAQGKKSLSELRQIVLNGGSTRVNGKFVASIEDFPTTEQLADTLTPEQLQAETARIMAKMEADRKLLESLQRIEAAQSSGAATGTTAVDTTATTTAVEDMTPEQVTRELLGIEKDRAEAAATAANETAGANETGEEDTPPATTGTTSTGRGRR